MLAVMFLLGCGGDPVVGVKTSKLAGLPLPGGMNAFVADTYQKKVETCYTKGLQDNAELAGTATVTAQGSHGILKVEATGDAQKLINCAKNPIEDSRNQRTLGDGDNAVGFELLVTYAPG